MSVISTDYLVKVVFILISVNNLFPLQPISEGTSYQLLYHTIYSNMCISMLFYVDILSKCGQNNIKNVQLLSLNIAITKCATLTPAYVQSLK